MYMRSEQAMRLSRMSSTRKMVQAGRGDNQQGSGNCCSQEVERGEDDAIEADMMQARLVVHEPRVKVDLTKYVEHHEFAFDDVLDDHVSNDAVYRSTVQPLVATIFRSGKVCPCQHARDFTMLLAGIAVLCAQEPHHVRLLQ